MIISEEGQIIRRINLLQKKRDLFVGKVFNHLTIIDFTRYKKDSVMCLAQCECGKEKEILFVSVTSGNTKSCGCMRKGERKRISREESERSLMETLTAKYLNKSFNYITVVSFLGYGKGHHVRCIGQCVCGEKKEYDFYSLLKNKPKSCGCRRKEFSHRTHGLTASPIFKIWPGIKQRCYNNKAANFYLYGGRGIEMCDAWRYNFIDFYNWCISKKWEVGLQIDRFPDKMGNYTPENCRCATPRVNSNNKTNNRVVCVDGELLNLSEACKIYSVPFSTARNRLDRGWTDQDTFTKAIHTEFSKYKSK